MGSTSLTTSATGTMISEMRYKAWGEVRYASGTTPTKYQYTGQYSYTSDFGLMFYNARWYDSALGRFAQADTMVPGAGNSQAWDRYAYANNDPVKYSDPSGHCPICYAIAGGIVAGIFSAHWFGLVPDYRGIRTVEKYMNPKTDDIRVAAGIAVQSEWLAPWDHRPVINAYNAIRSVFGKGPSSSGLGIAQVTDNEMKTYGLTGDQEDPSVAVQAMTKRIDSVTQKCDSCSERDKLIAAALAQNGPGFGPDAMGNVLKRPKVDGGLDWAGYFNTLNPKGNLLDVRAAGHHNFDTRFMLQLCQVPILYTNDK